MKVLVHGIIIKFSCDSCGCAFIAGINEVRTPDKGENYYAKCPACGNECHADIHGKIQNSEEQA